MKDTPSKFINIMILVDTEATTQGDTTVYMASDDKGTSNGTNGLTINASVGDTIRWRITGIIPDENPLLAQFKKTGGDDVIGGSPYPNDDYWEVMVANEGSESYCWYFSINGKGSYTWTPQGACSIKIK